MSPIHRGLPGTEPWDERILRALGLRVDARLERALAVSLERVLHRVWNSDSEQNVLLSLVTSSPRHVGLSTIAGMALRHAPLDPDVGCVLIAAFSLLDDDPAYRAGLGNRGGSGDTGYYVRTGASTEKGKAPARWVPEPRRLGDMLAVLLENDSIRADVRALATEVLLTRLEERTLLTRLRAIQGGAASDITGRAETVRPAAPPRTNTAKRRLLLAVVHAERATVKDLALQTRIKPNTIRKYAAEFDDAHGDHFSLDEDEDGTRTLEWKCPAKDSPCSQCIQLGARGDKPAGGPPTKRR